MAIRLRAEYRDADWKRMADQIKGTVFGAARAAMQELAQSIQREGRARISAAGFTGKWVTGYRTYIFPKTPGFSTDLVVRGFHSYNIANVFQRGAKVSGKPLLWIPLPTCPDKVRGKPTTAARLIEAGVRLRRINGRGHPLLVGSVIRSAPRARRKAIIGIGGGRLLIRSGKVTVQQLINGQRNVRRTQARAGFGGSHGPQSVSIPLFVGLTAVEINKRFDIASLYDKGAADLPRIFDQKLKELNS